MKHRKEYLNCLCIEHEGDNEDCPCAAEHREYAAARKARSEGERMKSELENLINEIAMDIFVGVNKRDENRRAITFDDAKEVAMRVIEFVIVGEAKAAQNIKS